MMKILENRKAQARLEHVISHYFSSWINKPERKSFLCNRIVQHEDNYEDCFRSLQTYYRVKIMHDWFHNPDVNMVRHYCYNYSKLYYIVTPKIFRYKARRRRQYNQYGKTVQRCSGKFLA